MLNTDPVDESADPQNKQGRQQQQHGRIQARMDI